jgi:exopolyphosphatase/guanosine-5'-triphosphate,3'-diphosphate pyrophosphatase
MRYTLIIAAVLITAATLWFHGRSDFERRAAIDIGSGSIKCVIADVDEGSHVIKRIVKRLHIKADFAENIVPQTGNRIPPAMMAEGINHIRFLKTQASSLGAESISAVATEAFRNAENGHEYIKRLSLQTDIPAQVIDEREEAIIGVRSALNELGNPQGPLVVWDIGGGTSQITLRHKARTYYHTDRTASVSFKNDIIYDIQHRISHTPNPMSEKNFRQALRLAREKAAKLPKEMRAIIRNEECLVVGIGPVHSLSVLGQIAAKNPYTQIDLRKAIGLRLGLTDWELGGGFAPTDLSNLILVLGYMQELDIQEVKVLEVSLAEGLLLSPAYWN